MTDIVDRTVERAVIKFESGRNNLTVWTLLAGWAVASYDNEQDLRQEARVRIVDAIGQYSSVAATYVPRYADGKEARERLIVMTRAGWDTGAAMALPVGRLVVKAYTNDFWEHSVVPRLFAPPWES